jgi:ribosome-binding ATPase YchF (GTP1/OBG family)
VDHAAGGATAPEAAGVIHSDFERHFIKAEVVDYEDLVATGSIVAPPRPRKGTH